MLARTAFWFTTSFSDGLGQRHTAWMTSMKDKDGAVLRMPANVKLVVVRPQEFFGWGRVSLWAMLLSAATTLGICITSQMPATAWSVPLPRWPNSWELVHLVFIIGITDSLLDSGA